MQPQNILKQYSITSETPHNEAKDGPLIPHHICTCNTNPLNKSLSSLNYQLWYVTVQAKKKTLQGALNPQIAFQRKIKKDDSLNSQ